MAEEQPQLQSETVDFLFDHLSDALEKQLATNDGLDGKVQQAFGAGSVILGLTALGEPTALNPWLLLSALLAYLAISGITMAAMWPRKWKVIRHADKIWPEFWDLEPFAIKHALLQQVSDGYATNADKIRSKAWLLRFAVLFLTAEAGFVGAAVVEAAF